VILEGEATVSVGGKQVATLGAGAVVGEAGLIGHKLRNATVTSSTPLQLLHIDAADFEGVLKRRPQLAQCLTARTKPAEEATDKAG
jgi:CRP/FNR family transcriptional regulator, cyclic AMP receptor protein